MPQPQTTASQPEQPSYRGAVRRLLHDRLLDAARELLAGGRPWAQVTMAEIATAAGVSRQTLYKEFGTRDEFGQALVIREGGRFLQEVDEAIGAHPDDPLAALTAGIERFLTLTTTDPFFALLLNDDGTAGLLPLVTTQSRPVLHWARERVAGAICMHWPQAAAVDLRALADTLVRLAISHATVPEAEPAQTAEAITTLLAPAIEAMLASAVVATRDAA